jgi:hypothetical protein
VVGAAGNIVSGTPAELEIGGVSFDGLLDEVSVSRSVMQ